MAASFLLKAYRKKELSRAIRERSSSRQERKNYVT